MEKKGSIFTSIIFLLSLSVNAQQYFYCDSTFAFKGDSIAISSTCPYYVDLTVFPYLYVDTAMTTKSGKFYLKELRIEYRGNTIDNKGVYKVYRNNKIIQECEFENYQPHGTFKSYTSGYKISPRCKEKIKFKNGEKHGKSYIYSTKTCKILIKERYYKGQRIKRVEKYEKWDFD